MTSFKFDTENDCEFEIWAPKSKQLAIVSDSGDAVQLCETAHSFFRGNIEVPRPFRYWLDIGHDKKYPDPRSVYLPEGVHGPSQIGESTFAWSDQKWKGNEKSELIIYELHVGTFTEQGDFDSCRMQLDYLVSLGVNAIELLPLAQCPGRWNWGYDGVGLWAVNHNYGSLDDLRRFVDECHARDVSVIHDVVYNHVGPEGNYMGVFGNYFSKKHGTPWGSAFDFDGPNKEIARKFVIENALYWLEEFHFDGLRLDAIHFMFDDSEYCIQQELCDRVREFEQKQNRRIHLIGEANIYDHGLIHESEKHSNVYSAIWADDLMHAIYSVGKSDERLTPRIYDGADDVGEALTHGYLYQGPVMKRVSITDRKANHRESFGDDFRYLESLVVALQTHDSVGNHPQGKRLHQLTSTAFQKAAAPLILLYPAIPMIFMGEEFAAESPFMFFADFIDERLRRSVDKGRTQEYPHHDWSQSIKPSEERAFYDCKLKIPDADNDMLAWYKRLISLRKQWRKAGLLNASQLTVKCDPARNIFAFEYASSSQRSFVVSRIAEDRYDEQAIDLKIVEGKVLMDSNTETESADSSVIQIGLNQAVIGLGEVQFT